MKKLKPKHQFYTKASYALSRGTPIEAIYDLANDYDIQVSEVGTYLENKKKSNAVSGALMAGREEKDALYNKLDEKFLEEYSNIIVISRGEDVIFYEYQNGVYTQLLDRDVYNYVDSLMARHYLLEYRASSRMVKDTVRRIGALFSRTKDRYFTEEEIYKQKWLLNLKNGLLNMETFKLTPHTPSYFSTVQVPYEYNPEAECPMFLKFIETVSNQNPSTGQMIQEMFGYCLGNGNPKHKVFYLYGDTARNGKSTTAKLICGLIGWGNVSTLSLGQMESENSSILTSIIGKQINFSDEISSKYVESSRLTAMSAEGIVEVNPKFKHSFLHVVKTKFIIACNDIPRFKDSQGMKHRMISIPFKHHFKEAERIERYDEILLEKEGSGILNWAIEGMKAVKKNNTFTINEESQEDAHDNMLQSNPVYAFMEMTYDFDDKSEDHVLLENLYGSYDNRAGTGEGFRLFCHDKGILPMSYFVFCRELKRFARETGKISQGKSGGKARYYKNLIKKPKIDLAEEEFQTKF
ncbi:MAG TPA: phage/plasmid primase, P4 family [Stenomitos sp.]